MKTIPCLLAAVLSFLSAAPSPGLDAGGTVPGSEDRDARAARGAEAPPLDPALAERFLATLRGVENLRISSTPGGTILEGSLLSPYDLALVGKVAGMIPGTLNLCRLDRVALETAASRIQKELEGQGMSGLALTVLGDRLFLKGIPTSPEDPERVRRICAAYELSFIDGTSAGRADTRAVLFQVCFIEVSRQAFEELGISWPSSLTVLDPYGVRLDRLTYGQSLQATVNLLVQRGQGKILSRPLLTCRSGENASFLAGGEIPIPQKDKEGGITVLWKNYGIILEVAPMVEPGGRISARISTEISTVDRANAVEGIPGILTRRVSTSLSLEDGQTAMLSGLVNKEDAKLIQSLPLLGDIPVLGELFRSRGFQQRETELIIFLTPQLTVTAPPELDHLAPPGNR